MNIVTTLRPNTPFPKKAVQRYDKKIKKLVLDGRNIFSLLCEICFLFLRKRLRGFSLVGCFLSLSGFYSCSTSSVESPLAVEMVCVSTPFCFSIFAISTALA